MKPLSWVLATALLPMASAAPKVETVKFVPKSIPVESEVLAVWRKEGHRFTPGVKAAWLAHAREAALRELVRGGHVLPEDFLAWVDDEPVVAATVFGARGHVANVLMMLRSLELDLGEKVVREEYTQLALAMAVVHAVEGMPVDVSDRELLEIAIPGDPRQLVDTRDASRPLDLNDHIINFLAAHTIEEDVVVGHKKQPPPLKYDDKGIAIPPRKNAKLVKVAVTERRTRTLYAADVLASRAWQEKFNGYMKSKGQDVSIDCGDGVISWKSKAAVRAERKKIAAAFVMFRSAYEEKGLLPKARDAKPSPAESMAYLIRNDRHVFPDELREQRAWPKYPLKAPWTTLTLLAADNQPLREREERWVAFRDKGEMRTYGEYIGPIAQQFDMQSARRLSPFAFHYKTYQMMAKDGGVCGTMANMGVRTYNTLGMPSCTAGQPGHCALIRFVFDPKTDIYACKGGQFATGGPDKTRPHTPWVFGDVDARKPMVYYQSVAYGTNFDLQLFLDAMMAYQLFRVLPEAERWEHGMELLESGLALNPYSLLLVDAGMGMESGAMEKVGFWKALNSNLKGVEKPGCPKDGLYGETALAGLFAALSKQAVPENKEEAKAVLAFLTENGCRNPEALVSYQVALDGLEVVVGQTETAFRAHLESTRTEAGCKFMAETLRSVANRISDKKVRKAWLLGLWNESVGHESYLSPKNKILTDAAVVKLGKMLRKKPAPVALQIQPLLDQVVGELAARIKSGRDPKSCTRFSKRIAAVHRQIKDPVQARTWLEALAKSIAGHEEYQPKKGKKQQDPCVKTIAQLLAGPVGS